MMWLFSFETESPGSLVIIFETIDLITRNVSLCFFSGAVDQATLASEDKAEIDDDTLKGKKTKWNWK